MADTTNVANLTYEMMKRLNSKMDTMQFDMDDIKLRTSASEDHMRGVVTSIAGINARLDRVDTRLGRIERRLDLNDGAGDN